MITVNNDVDERGTICIYMLRRIYEIADYMKSTEKLPIS